MQNKTIKLPAAIVKAARLFCSKQDVREQFTGILFDKKGCVVASNGHVLIKADHEPLKNLEESLIVRINGTKLPKKAYEVEFVFFDGERGVVRMYNGHGSIMDDVRSFDLIDKRYTNYESVTKENELVSIDKIGINPHYMDVVAQAQNELGIIHAGVEMRFQGQSNAIQIKFRSPEYNAIAVVMPMRL